MKPFHRVNKEIKQLRKVPEFIWTVSGPEAVTGEELDQGVALQLELKPLSDVAFPGEGSLLLDLKVRAHRALVCMYVWDRINPSCRVDPFQLPGQSTDRPVSRDVHT